MTDTDAKNYYNEDVKHTSYHVGERDSEGCFWCCSTHYDINEAVTHVNELITFEPNKQWQIVRQDTTNTVCFKH